MKLTKRPAAARGKTELGWLHSQHTFSFGEYQDPAHVAFRALRVINDDIVEPGKGFGTHSHRDAEILSYVLEGQLAHKDSMGNGSVIERGSLQYMSAGDGVSHSEFNPSRNARAHFLQVWILPDEGGGEPRYAEKQLPTAAKPNSLTLVFAGKPRDEAIPIRADADVYLGKLDAGHKLVHRTTPGRGVWIHVIEGGVTLGANAAGEARLGPGDGAAVEDVSELAIESENGAELLLFDLR